MTPALVACAFAGLCACEKPPPEPESAGFLPAAPAAASGCGNDGRLQTRFYGAIDGEVSWTADSLDCEGMRRPGDEGARLRFAGAALDTAIAIIVAIPMLEPQVSAQELPSNVTLIEEGTGRFFTSATLDSCWTDVDEQSESSSGVYAVSGTVYCIAPLGEVNGDSSISFEELQFTGLIDWGIP